MARSLYVAADRSALLGRLDQLRPEARPRWGAMTAPARVPGSWPEDLARLRGMLAAATPPDPAVRIGEHPIFGTMTPEDWGVLLYKHTDHHLRQFGL